MMNITLWICMWITWWITWDNSRFLVDKWGISLYYVMKVGT
jgi:hypothetical protein